MARPNEFELKEERALLALVSATLHADEAEVSDDEVRRYLAPEMVLSVEDEDALARAGGNPLAQSTREGTEAVLTSQHSEAFLALHRKRPTGGFSAKSEEELKRKRDELIAKLRQRKDKS